MFGQCGLPTLSHETLTEPISKRKAIMVTITINLENGNEASDACREVARMIEDGYTSGIIGCSGDTFEIEGDILSDDEEEQDEDKVNEIKKK